MDAKSNSDGTSRKRRGRVATPAKAKVKIKTRKVQPKPRLVEPTGSSTMAEPLQGSPIAASPEPSATMDALYVAAAAHPLVTSPPAPEAQTVDFERLSFNLGRLVEQGGRAMAAWLQPLQSDPKRNDVSQELVDAARSLGRIAETWIGDPARFIEAQTAFSSNFLTLWAHTLRRLSGEDDAPVVPHDPSDKRFASPAWRESPIFDFMRQAHAITSRWAEDLVAKADPLDEHTRAKAAFYVRQISSAMAPSNFLPTNPELLRETLASSGDNLVRGAAMFAEDIAAGKGALRIRQTDASKFELGVNMAASPGKVVFRNELMELIQYSPSTESVFKRPLLIVPPWINKFYILDLNPEKSFVKWAVSQGLTVFLISWVNPDSRHRDMGFDTYMQEGIFAALDAIEAATGERDVTAIGYCVGGTMLAITLAYMAAIGDRRIGSATFFAAQTDFSEAGDLKIFVDEEQLKLLEARMAETGYLDGAQMANAFNMLRPNDLIWSYVVNNYMKGKPPLAFDLLTWNADATRLPAANHSFYLRNCYLENRLSKGDLEILGRKLSLGDVTIPVYNLATREDHIAPARSVFNGAKLFGGEMRYVMGGSGHIAGVINPPAKPKYQYWTGPKPGGTFDDWVKSASEHPGSWWLDWIAWVTAQAPDKVPAREPGSDALPALGDAPGEYVRVTC